MNLYFIFRFYLLKKLRVIGKLRVFVAVNIIKEISQRHIPMFVMMAIRLTIGSNVNQLRSVIGRVKRIEERMSEFFSVVQ